jgi:tripartite-type tricarboxylate transporter receptor subunit TctC
VVENRTMRTTLLQAGAGCLVASFALPLLAQDYPVRPIRLMVPWPPGGGVDIAARSLQPKMAEQLGQPVVVDNRPGAAGMIGTQVVARAPADGYTILLGAAGPNAILPLSMPKAPYDALGDFAEVAHIANTLYVLIVHPSSPAHSIEELVESTPAQFAAFRKADLARWARMIKETNVRMEP